MIALAPETSAQVASQRFEAMLPSIKRIASYAFRRIGRVRRLELIEDAIATAHTAFVRLVDRGLWAVIYPTPLAKYAIRRVCAGRQVGGRQNCNDVLSPLAQRTRHIQVESLHRRSGSGDWQELIEDRRATPAEIACCKLDFADWLAHLKRFKRRVALRLAAGDTTNDLARRLGVSAARISQLRQELRLDWDAFQAVPAGA